MMCGYFCYSLEEIELEQQFRLEEADKSDAPSPGTIHLFVVMLARAH
jgi:hypothetical protein